MIKSSELRVGNIIKDHDEILFVHRINRDESEGVYLINKEGVGWSTYNHIEPIPVNGELLLKIGFRKLGNDYAYKEFIIHQRKRGLVVRKGLPIIKHLHQLQNMYYTFNEEDIDISLNVITEYCKCIKYI